MNTDDPKEYISVDKDRNFFYSESSSGIMVSGCAYGTMKYEKLRIDFKVTYTTALHITWKTLRRLLRWIVFVR